MTDGDGAPIEPTILFRDDADCRATSHDATRRPRGQRENGGQVRAWSWAALERDRS